MQNLYDVIEARNAELVTGYNRKAAGDTPIAHVPTGLDCLDNYGMIEPAILTIIEAHPGDGKTSVALQLAEGAARFGYSPNLYAFEDPLPMLSDRLVASQMGESAFKLRRYGLDGDIPARLNAATEALDWARNVNVSGVKLDSKVFLEDIKRNTEETTGIIIIDYAQAFDSEHDEKSVERVIARLAWGLAEFSKNTGIASVLFTQVKNEVIQRGNRWFDTWKFNKERNGQELKPEPQAVEGFRPKDGDAQWSTALYQRGKDFISVFRPGNWLKKQGFAAKDDTIEFLRVKGNYSAMDRPVRCRWNGSNSTISEPSK